MTRRRFLAFFAIMLIATATFSNVVHAAPVPFNAASGLNVQEYWQGSQPRYWIGNRGTKPLDLFVLSQSWLKPGAGKSAPIASLGLSIPPGSATDIDATRYIGIYRVQFRTADNAMLGEIASPRRVSTTLSGTEIRLYSALNGVVAPQYNVWYSMPRGSYTGDRTLTTRLNIIGYSGVVVILPGDKNADGMAVVKVKSATSPVAQNAQGTWFIDTRKVSKVSSVQTIEITCSLNGGASPSLAILHATMRFPNTVPVSLDRGFLVGAAPLRQPTTKARLPISVRKK